MSFFNLHTHQAADAENVSIQNLHDQFQLRSIKSWYSTGLHPWHLSPTEWKSDFEQLKAYSIHEHVLAIGECGLDRVCATPFRLQEEVFKLQIEWANLIAKPIIIHCVRAHRECIQLLKEMNNQMPVIFHGFNNSLDVALQIIKEGYYLSFGHSLFKPAMEPVFSAIAPEKLFLETDDHPIRIEAVYRQAAKIKNNRIDQLSLQIERNMLTVFNKKIS